MARKTVIENIEDIKLMVDAFYGKIYENEELIDIFNNKIGERQFEHLKEMYRFWQITVIVTFLWIGFVCANSIKEAWFKIRAPTVTVPLGN